MTALRKGKHRVILIPRREQLSDRGLLVQTDGDPVEYQVNVQPSSTSERQALGITTDTVYRLKYFPQMHGGKPWVGGPYSRILWEGKEYEQLGDPMLTSMSPQTGHVKVMMKAKWSEVA